MADEDRIPTRFIRVSDESGSRRIAVKVRDGAGPPVVWLGGFRSDMGATKARAVDAWAERAGRRLVRFDYSGHGASEGAFAASTISTWLADAEAVLDAHAAERPVLIGSSMGGWIACLAARARLTRGQPPAAGLVLIAPALDFTEDLMWDMFPDEIRERLLRDGVWMRQSAYAPEPDPVSMRLIEDGRRHRLLTGPLDLRCPVHILQGMRDPDVPHPHAFKLLDRLPTEGTVMTLIADGDHRLSRPQDIARLIGAVAEMG
ncbi:MULTISPECIES: alpha/beta hydrolase [Methylobacterium]|uniref:2-succinyl-6-hydroxy-2, 4-cyclohexadiene-1-carboxylate synthase n=2 Tax=Pseudomonadota TaxID=1224 RepID=A0ABQ4SS86_9HYPH|nr:MULTISPECIES: alpha/beta hydrolase [Methylobacterium]PIU07128.1 MAG: alpha/beta hydrolase [Methylobacterium sp. CG09_land_8_20_14_0_10_71_15]PIU11452.1 MAG: alpha/beta hydrolase [Methylobacterium sp. CG08_land_8_20_14_0_20_71_15]GBU18309.1 alpha/beta hydrolase [Methylobacterium sp.]GJE05952.1 2-succinyl-6-hydroxy-2, 4-cyclohexadiene-1-carboxylate synthase [Methylobacterium jeotgali]